ncbi:MAG: TolC family protein [Saprospiraceae bacterium]|nr:TolC family protein [Saprospiraceae bacterium]MBK7788740.1 TolC family protein [Saprospiraceae bacterium]MBK8850299.1 TolC family protein [Saprospiraceae bacterium]MBL0083014.1 TolC family protein [Saprospiraceae bacterium]
MNSKKITYIIAIIIISTVSVRSQAVLTLEEAKKAAQNSNLDIAAAAMEAAAASMQVYRANAGLGPRVDWNFNTNGSFNKVNLEFIDGRTLDRYGRSFAPGSNISLSWTLYDGGRMQNRYEILKKQNELSAVTSQQTTEELLRMVTELYYTMARQKYVLDYLKKGVKYYEERLTITEERWKVGRGSKLDYLQSQNDLNTQLAAIQNSELALSNFKVNMNLMLNRAADTDFTTEEIANDLTKYEIEEMVRQAVSNDEALMVLDKNIELSRLATKDWEGSRLPRIGFTTALGYNFSTTNAGQVLNSQSLGFNGGLSASWNLIDGGHAKKQIQISQQQSKILETRKQLQLARIRTNATLAVQQINATDANLKLEQNNKDLAEENLTIALEKFKLGASTILELNDAQQRYDASIQRYIDAVFALHFARLMAKEIVE